MQENEYMCITMWFVSILKWTLHLLFNSLKFKQSLEQTGLKGHCLI